MCVHVYVRVRTPVLSTYTCTYSSTIILSQKAPREHARMCMRDGPILASNQIGIILVCIRSSSTNTSTSTRVEYTCTMVLRVLEYNLITSKAPQRHARMCLRDRPILATSEIGLLSVVVGRPEMILVITAHNHPSIAIPPTSPTVLEYTCTGTRGLLNYLKRVPYINTSKDMHACA